MLLLGGFSRFGIWRQIVAAIIALIFVQMLTPSGLQRRQRCSPIASEVEEGGAGSGASTTAILHPYTPQTATAIHRPRDNVTAITSRSGAH